MTFQTSSQTLEILSGHVLDLASLPPIFVSLTHFNKHDSDAFEDRLLSHGAHISYDLNEVKIVLTKADRKRRAQFDLRSQGLNTEEVEPEPDASTLSMKDAVVRQLQTPSVKVIKLAWMAECLSQGHLVPIDEYLLFQGRTIPPPTANTLPNPQTPPKRKRASPDPIPTSSPAAILTRARHDAAQTSPYTNRDSSVRRFGDKHHSRLASHAKPPLLLQTTSSHDGHASDSSLPPTPTWVSAPHPYACQRATPATPPNAPFLAELAEIRTARLLTGDEIGVRAYSTAIAAVAAYPHGLRSAREMLRLPGCDAKIATLFVEYANTGRVAAADEARADPVLSVLKLFYEIWGVGATTAREFYYERGWRELDDVVEFGWAGLSRVQQIGVKYYDEFLLGIPRSEVEGIAATVHRHAVKVRDGRVQSLLVGGYRRGKEVCGDVDLLVSHPDERATKDLVRDIVESLGEEGCITHTLLLALTSSHRDQQTLPFRANKTQIGSGFDTLDKALVVWQDPHWDPKAKNPAPHRRVDIIVSPWRTVGCGVAGWTSGTTFQRDLRRYAKHIKGWKFDSSGVRERGTGMVVDLEGYYSAGGAEMADGGRGAVVVGKWPNRSKTMEEAERRVFEGMGLEWREPWERCTG